MLLCFYAVSIGMMLCCRDEKIVPENGIFVLLDKLGQKVSKDWRHFQ